MSELPDLWVNPADAIAAGASAAVWAIDAHNCEVVNQDVRYVPASRLADLTRELEEARQKIEAAHRRDVQPCCQQWDTCVERCSPLIGQLRAQLAERTREREEARANELRANERALWEYDRAESAERKLAESEAMVRGLREALRERAIERFYDWKLRVNIVCCHLCNSTWRSGGPAHHDTSAPEQHAPGCLAALADGGEK